ncbi:hypothetical protein [Oryza sativa Japonica Group]|uniref:Uncharacterized protein n=1 Tax=Oryza sativa subsp. japonica TaxID=39947 RepID=Q5JJZ2_ORYSJ|nr:hypothetical protein [Oryza sativa Japonica Group]
MELKIFMVRTVLGKLGRHLPVVAVRRSPAADEVRAAGAEPLVAGRRRSSIGAKVSTVGFASSASTFSDVPEESVSVEEGSEVFVEAQGKSHRSQTTL